MRKVDSLTLEDWLNGAQSRTVRAKNGFQLCETNSPPRQSVDEEHSLFAFAAKLGNRFPSARLYWRPSRTGRSGILRYHG
jgi:hypothetical protein